MAAQPLLHVKTGMVTSQVLLQALLITFFLAKSNAAA